MGCGASSASKEEPRPAKGEAKAVQEAQPDEVKQVEPAKESPTATPQAAPQDDEVGYLLLKEQSSRTSNTMIQMLAADAYFVQLAAGEGEAIVKRDAQDDEKLWRGVNLSIERGVLERLDDKPEVTVIDVHGKSAAEITEFMISKLPEDPKGCLIIIQGMSGTGKGTTTAALKAALNNTSTWSNGNVFRALTYLAAAYCQKHAWDLTEKVEDVLAPENVAAFMSCLSFKKVDDAYDIYIKSDDLSIHAKVGDIQNTKLKEPVVAKNVPLVAEFTQGDVIKFATAAVAQMAEDGMNVVLEGRAATVQYFVTPFRYELVIEDTALLGQRRAAQRVMAGCLEAFKEDRVDADSIRLKAVELCRSYVEQAYEQTRAPVPEKAP
eukprot:TRINITY_DN29944_c0_g1_i1.p1 TRINITY_DN29944_c0_g1~~TRINITY_DN29944_c0_g1_i1.p1  ORF type:complete len:379 (+),score=162.75 TRINITY_DN29944_c0_g1_i1:57-1193(+)